MVRGPERMDGEELVELLKACTASSQAQQHTGELYAHKRIKQTCKHLEWVAKLHGSAQVGLALALACAGQRLASGPCAW